VHRIRTDIKNKINASDTFAIGINKLNSDNESAFENIVEYVLKVQLVSLFS
jgi:hypothetical protein